MKEEATGTYSTGCNWDRVDPRQIIESCEERLEGFSPRPRVEVVFCEWLKRGELVVYPRKDLVTEEETTCVVLYDDLELEWLLATQGKRGC